MAAYYLYIIFICLYFITLLYIQCVPNKTESFELSLVDCVDLLNITTDVYFILFYSGETV